MQYTLLSRLLQNRIKTTLFTLPKVKPLNNRKTAKARESKSKAVINNTQRAAWINTINKGYADDNTYQKGNGTNNASIGMYHFHLSTIDMNKNDNIVLKIDTCSAMYLTH